MICSQCGKKEWVNTTLQAQMEKPGYGYKRYQCVNCGHTKAV